MCLILIALNHHPRYPLVMAANRDEYFRRGTAPAAFWPDAPNLLAGRDLEAGGTWLGITRSGRLAAVTNVREPSRNDPQAHSRGELTRDFLLGDESPQQFLTNLQSRADAYNGFNLLVGAPDALLYYSNRDQTPRTLPPGLHGVSNHLLNSPWPKVEQGKAALGQLLDQPAFALEDLLPLLNNRAQAPDVQLPDTGVGPELERILSSRFIHAPALGYGTRASTALRLDHHGRVEWMEWTWAPDGNLAKTITETFALDSRVDF